MIKGGGITVDQFMLLSLIMVEGNVCVFVSFRFFFVLQKL